MEETRAYKSRERTRVKSNMVRESVIAYDNRRERMKVDDSE